MDEFPIDVIGLWTLIDLKGTAHKNDSLLRFTWIILYYFAFHIFFKEWNDGHACKFITIMLDMFF